MKHLFTLLTTVLLVGLREVKAAPETYYPTAFSMTGTSASARFGESIACSRELPVGHSYHGISLVAVGAPGFNNGEGVVYIYNPDSPNTPILNLTSPSPGANRHFGAAVAFIKDENGDSIDELVVGEPYGGLPGVGGTIYVYLSQVGSTPYHPAPLQLSKAEGYGSVIIGLRGIVSPFSHFVVSNPAAPEVSAAYIDCSGGACLVSEDVGRFQGSGVNGYGHSLCELPPRATAGRIAVGSIQESASSGTVYDLEESGGQTTIAVGAPGEQFGFGVSGNSDANLGYYLGFSAPGGDKVGVAIASSDSYACSVSIPMSNIPASSRAGLVHQAGTFNGLFGLTAPGSTTFASYRDESSTGGSIGIFGASTLGLPVCTAVRQINNCQFDASQEQGHTLVGDDHCFGNKLGPKAMLLSGSPGFNGDAGRVDAYFSGDQYTSPHGCSEPTATPTYTPTYTPTPTHTPTPTPTPTAIDTPRPTSTPIPTGISDTPIDLDPAVTRLPPPVVIDSFGAGQVEISVPYTFRYSDAFIKKVGAFLSKATRKKVTPAQVVVQLEKSSFYEFVVRPTLGTSAAEVSSQAKYSAQAATASKIIKLRSRLNRVTLGRLTPGQTYSVTYQRKFEFKKFKKTFSTKVSAPAVFTKKP